MTTKRTSGSSDIPASRSSGSSQAVLVPGSSILHGVSGKALLSNIRALSKRERKTLLNILLHLIEIDRRRLYLPEGYSSLFEFCVKALDYSKATAGRRIAVARCMAKFPQIYQVLFSGRTNFSNIALITGVITPRNVVGLLSWIEGKSKREVDELVSRYNPGKRIRERIRPVCVRTILPLPGNLEIEDPAFPGSGNQDGGRLWASKESTLAGESGKTASGDSTGHVEKDSSDNNCTAPSDSIPEKGGESAERSMLEIGGVACEKDLSILEQMFEVKFGAGNGFLEKLEQVRSLLSTKHHRKLELGELIEIMLDEYIERHSPWARQQRRELRERKRLERLQLDSEKCSETKLVDRTGSDGNPELDGKPGSDGE